MDCCFVSGQFQALDNTYIRAEICHAQRVLHAWMEPKLIFRSNPICLDF
jgi:hypothetical protein